MKSTILFASESIALRSPHILVLLAIVALSLFTESATAMAMDPLKRARVTSSSLIPFPRVGRSIGGSNGGHDLEADSQLYFGQKRTGKSSLIPFPRVGRGGSNTWEVEPDMLGDFDHMADLRRQKETEEKLALAYLYPALRFLLQRYQEDEDLGRKSF